MGSTYRYISSEDENREIIDWFSPFEPELRKSDDALHLWFPSIGELLRDATGNIIQDDSPIVSMYPVKKVRGALLSVGEVHVLPSKLKDKFPELNSINSKFRSWLKKKELVYSKKSNFDGIYNYYLEGSIKNYNQEIYAFPQGLALLKSEQYFVTDGESSGRLDTICKSLALRGVQGLQNA